MIPLLITICLALPIGLALLSPPLLVYLSLVTGAAPLSLGQEGIGGTDLGRMDLFAVRLFGIWIAALLVILFHFGRSWFYIVENKSYALFLLFCCLSLIWAPSLLYGSRMMAKLSAPFLFFLLVLTVISTRKQLKLLEQLIIATGLCAAVVAVVAKLAGYSAGEKLGVGIPGLGPAATSAHLAIIAMLSLAASRTISPSWRLPLTIFLAATVVACFTRITIVAMGIGFAAVWFLSTGGIFRFIMPTIGLAAAPALFLLNDSFRQRMFKSGDYMSASTMMADPSNAIEQIHGSGRFEAWNYVMTTFFEPNPLLGSGVGTTQHYFYTHLSTGLNVIHSEYIRLLAEVGIFGCLLFLVGFASFARRLWMEARSARSVEAKTYSVAALGGLIVYFTFMATDNAFDYVTACGIFVFTFISMSQKAKELDALAGDGPAFIIPSPLDSQQISMTARRSAEQHGFPYHVRKYPIIAKE